GSSPANTVTTTHGGYQENCLRMWSAAGSPQAMQTSGSRSRSVSDWRNCNSAMVPSGWQPHSSPRMRSSGSRRGRAGGAAGAGPSPPPPPGRPPQLLVVVRDALVVVVVPRPLAAPRRLERVDERLVDVLQRHVPVGDLGRPDRQVLNDRRDDEPHEPDRERP